MDILNFFEIFVVVFEKLQQKKQTKKKQPNKTKPNKTKPNNILEMPFKSKSQYYYLCKGGGRGKIDCAEWMAHTPNFKALPWRVEHSEGYVARKVRPSPGCAAKHHKGKLSLGSDGHVWHSKMDSMGIYRWYRAKKGRVANYECKGHRMYDSIHMCSSGDESKAQATYRRKYGNKMASDDFVR